MDHETRLEMLCEIIEEFEDFLEEKGITIENEDKQQAIADGEDPESISTIYGGDYGRLECAIEDILIAYDLLEEEK